ncbi:MAG: hypothetical protein K0U74_14040 [Alphaproteobacteria bacterium]|nr:hypothetical protein [Alphaproteobacteria bacterium]
MADSKSNTEEIAALKQEVAELGGLALATGVILTQLLQKSCMREMNPQASAGEIVDNARTAIAAFSEETSADPKVTERALAAVQQYEDQIRSVLRV